MAWQGNALLRALGERDGWKCVYCGALIAHLAEHAREWWSVNIETGVEKFRYTAVSPYVFGQRDHVVPRSRGGSNDMENLVLSCGECNGLKGSQPVEEFLLAFIGEAA